ncbi:MAG: hypothetical protein FWC91_01560 [Defluviitaleaceae bacterium]|nr:hypothetical protein [Defluviitaleaceae bacterium]
MKKTFIKAITLSLVVLSTLLSPAIVNASDLDIGWWVDRVMEQDQQIQDLQRQLNEASSNVVRPQATPRPQHPNIRLQQPQSIVITPGEVQYVDIIVRNIGSGLANNVLVTASTDGPVNIEFIGNSNVLGNVAMNTNSIVRTRLSAHSNATAGNYSINLEFAFRDRDGSNETSQDSISIRIDAQQLEPRVLLQNFSVNQVQIFPGNIFLVSANLVNLGNGVANNVHTAIVDGLDSEGIFLSGAPNAPFLQTVEAGHSSAVSFGLAASDRITSGTFPIVFEVTGRDHAGEEISERFTYFVTVVAPATGANRAFVSIDNISSTAAGRTIGVNERTQISMQVTNTGNLAARNVRISASPLDSDAVVPQSANVQTINILEPGATQSLSFVFSPTADASSQYHMIGFEVVYDTGVSGDLETDTFEQFVGINVYNPDRDRDQEEVGRSRPRILVSAYSVYPMIVSAGEQFDLSMTFQNTSSTRAVYNIKITLQAVEYAERSGAVFTTVGASNTLFVNRLGPGETVDRDLRMFTVPNADPRTYNIEVTFDYEDEDFDEFQEVEQLSINVRQVTRLEVSNLQIPSHAMMFQPIFVDFNIINSGRVTLANLRVAVEGNFDTSGVDIFVGNMGRGNSANFAGQFTPEEPGEQHGILIVSGEDETGELIEFRHEFSVFVEEMMMWGPDDYLGGDRFPGEWDDPYSEGGGFFSQLWVWIVGGLLIVGIGAAIAIFIIRNKRNNRDLFQDFN